MIERGRNDYWLPPAWRGVASPGYLQMSRWHALVEELGGLRASPSGTACPGDGARPDPLSGSGLPYMSVLMEVEEAAQLDELREFVTKRLARHERLVLMLVHSDGLSLSQVAEVLDLPEATVRLVYTRTVAALRELIER